MTSGKTIAIGAVRIRSNQSLLDGLVGEAELNHETGFVRLVLTEDGMQADLEKGATILIPPAGITFIQKLG